MFELMDAYSQNAVIKVMGVGGGGGNAVQHMLTQSIEGVDFICVNTDAQALKNTKARTALQLGSNITKGLGAGASPEVGRHAAMEDRDRIIEVIEGADMLFITAGMGGGTGTGAAPIVAQVAKELGILTVAVVTKPFPFEGNKRMQIASSGIKELSQYVDSLITIPNEKFLSVLGKNTSLLDAAAGDLHPLVAPKWAVMRRWRIVTGSLRSLRGPTCSSSLRAWAAAPEPAPRRSSRRWPRNSGSSRWRW